MPVVEYSPLDEMDRADAARLAPLVQQPEPETSDDFSRHEAAGGAAFNPDQFLSVGELRRQFLDYMDSKVEEVEEAKDSRRYYHGAQLTAEQLRVLKARHQPVQIWNRVGRKINGIVGLVERMRGDPKAEGRDPKSEVGAAVATQSVRYVLDANQFKNSLNYWSLLQTGIDGIGGVQLVLQKGDKGDPDIGIEWVIGDEYFYDARSYRVDFKDVRYEGVAKWMDVEAAVEMFPDKEELLQGLFQGDSDLTTNPDREIKWLITSTRRVRMVEHWYKHKGKWCWAFYVANVLLDQGISPFFDERGNSTSSFEMWGPFIDQDGDRYSFVRTFKGPQDALNQGKSKTMALANSRRVVMDKGAVDDVEITRREVARHDGVVEKNKGFDLKVDDTTPEVATFTSFTQDAKDELDGFANANLAAASGAGLNSLSGKAIELLRQPGMAELGPFVLGHRMWKLNLYRKIWNAAQRHWKAERWIRVNNNQKLAEFIQLNGVDLDQWGRPVIVNAVGALDVNIVLDEGPDVISAMQELADKLSKYPPGTIPPQVLIELDPAIPRDEKDRVAEMMKPKPEQLQIQQAKTKLELEHAAGKNAKQAADTQKALAGAQLSLASAEQKKAAVTTEAARAGHLARASDLDAAEFVRDSLFKAHEVMAPFLSPQQGQAGMQPPPRQPAPIGAGMR
ncbi:portal protein [Bradyrhizobium betae]|uniref:Portal protein n=1 Tax=Bradyrhizobium betae TaxID=244734 RepID=A0A5P6NZ74_9BRAD|nr:hypothetical protein [Bradyrhizobium betae]MCS3725496.1 hypothetical protein [Bradyrhizobium betae]QFI71216.1 hypothetical protein F8237_01800 [Bradyrhizobium betae]